MSGKTHLLDLLDRLAVRPGTVVYCHTSFKYLSYLGLTAAAILETLLERLGPGGTLVLPSFAWNLDRYQRPWQGYRQYFDTRPVFDVRHTPTNIGWIPETFRTWPGVRRSANYWWSVCAHGPLAAELTADQDRVTHPFGPDSTFGILHRRGVVLLGLGVSLNTTSLALLPDYCLGDRHPHRVFTSEPLPGPVVGEDGRLRVTHSYWLLPEAVRWIKPSRVMELSSRLRDATRRADEAGAIHFAYPYGVYHDEALRLAEEARVAGAPAPWWCELPVAA